MWYSLLLPALCLASIAVAAPAPIQKSTNDHRVLILGGGMAGVIAARQLHAAGISDFVLVEALPGLGGRTMTHQFNGLTIELGANWVQGARILNRRVDLTARAGYRLTGTSAVPNQWESAAEYFNFDYEYAQSPEQSSWIQSGNNYNYTFSPTTGFGAEQQIVIDQRGYRTLAIKEAAAFMQPRNLLFNSTVEKISYSPTGVSVTLVGGKTVTADHCLVTFSMGVLQNTDVEFSPALTPWKIDVIQSVQQATYTKIFLSFKSKFWTNTQFGLYADPAKRGYYPVWQSLDQPGFLPGSHIYFVTVTGDESIRVEALTDAQVQAEMMAVLGPMYPHGTVPQPTGIYFRRWHQDPLFRGSYANFPPGYQQENMDNIRASIDQRLHFAGEGTSFEYFGFLHGAYYEGMGRGDQIAACLKGNCSGLPTGGPYQDLNKAIPYELPVGYDS